MYLHINFPPVLSAKGGVLIATSEPFGFAIEYNLL